MKQTHVRNVAPMLAARRQQIDRQKETKAITALVALGWVRSITERGLTLTEPPAAGSVKSDTNS